MKSSTSRVVSFAAVIVIIYGLQMAKVLLVPFLVAAFLALITVRPMLWMQSKRIPAILAALAIVSAIMFIITILGAIVGTSIADFTAAFATYQERLDVIIQGAFQFVAERLKGDNSLQGLSDMIRPGLGNGIGCEHIERLKDVLTNVFLIFFTMIFILLEASTRRPRCRRRLVAAPSHFVVRVFFWPIWVATLASRPLSVLHWIARWIAHLEHRAGFPTVVGDARVLVELRSDDRLHYCRRTGGTAGAGATGSW